MTPERASGRADGSAGGTRQRAVLVSVVLGIGTMATGAAVWVRSVASSAVDPEVPLAVTGAVAAPGVGAGGLVVVAAGLALALGGRWGRRLAAAAITGGGVLVAASAVGGTADPRAVALSAAQEAVGVAALAGPVAVTVMPWVVLVLAALTIVHGLRTAVVCDRWGAPSARHEVAGPRAPGPAVPAADTDASAPRGVAVDDHAAWDALTEGQDPT